MSHGIRWWGDSTQRLGDAPGFILRRRRADLALNDSRDATRESKIRDLVAMELLASGDPGASLSMLHLDRIIEAVDRDPGVPPSGLYVRRITVHNEGSRPAAIEAVRAARALREAPYDSLTDDQRLVRDAIREVWAGHWRGVFR